MKSSHRKDAANHPDPESCGTGRKARHEALTGADAGEVSSREIRQSRSPTLLCEAEGNMTVSAKARSPADPRGRRPSTRIEASSAGTGRPHTSPSEEKRLERPSKATSQTVGMSGCGESDESVVSKRPANRIQKSQWVFLEAELAEKRDSIKRNTDLWVAETSSRNEVVDSAGFVPKLISHARDCLGAPALTQEALTNVARHAQASRVEVNIQKLADCICMKIKDDGKSFQVQRVLLARGSKRLGLLGMRENGWRWSVAVLMSSPPRAKAPPSLRKFRSTRPCEGWIVDVVHWKQT